MLTSTVDWAFTGQAVAAAFLASLVEVVEAFTIVLAVSTIRGWRPAIFGATGGVVLLLILVAAFGPLLSRVPLQVFQLGVGILLLLFGMRWLRKAILRAVGIIPLHDEDAAFAEETAQLQLQGSERDARLHWLAGLAAFKAVVLEGLEVVFIVIAVGSQRGLLLPASLGALGACVLVLAIGVSVHRPLSRVPENTLKFAVGVMLSAFGVYWTGEGLGVSWPGHDLAIFGFAAALFLFVGLTGVLLIRRGLVEVVR
jgi:Ca2+/H+ antiporter, TMEM165/GDT1 family